MRHLDLGYPKIIILIASNPKYKFIKCGVLKVQYRKVPQNEKYKKNGEHNVTIIGALPLCGKMKYIYFRQNKSAKYSGGFIKGDSAR